jgi:hypothetical protein
MAELLGPPPEMMLGIILGVLFYVAPAVITVLKGKYGMAVLGLPVHPCWWFGAIRLAKPNSYWARHFYDADQMRQAEIRYS